MTFAWSRSLSKLRAFAAYGLTAILLLSTVVPSTAKAKVEASSCKLAALGALPGDDLRAWANTLSDLRERLKDDRRSTGQPLALQLTEADARILLQPALNQIIELENTLAVSKSSAKFRSQASQLHERILALEKRARTLEDVFHASYDLAALAELSLDRKKTEAYLSWSELRDSLEQIMLEKKLVPIMMDRDLSIRDFNYLLGSGLAPIGLIIKSILADNVNFTPTAFMLHDAGHALRSTKFLSASQWRELLAEVDSWPEINRAAGHFVIFFMTHETRKFKGPFTRTKKNGSEWANLSYRFSTEGAFGETALLSAPDRYQLLDDAAKRLDKIVKRL